MIKPRLHTTLNVLFFCVLLYCPVLLFAQTAGNPAEISRQTIDEVVDDMLRNEAVYKADRDRLYGMVTRRLMPRFNFNAMTRLAMGRYWNQASPEQKTALVDEFRTLLVRTYTNVLFTNIDEVYSYRDANISVDTSATMPNGDATVEVKIIGNSKKPVLVSLRMRRDGEDWKVIDVAANGVSLVVTYRTSFMREANLSGIEGLIKSLAGKNRANADRQQKNPPPQ